MNTIVDWDRDTPQWSAVLDLAANCGQNSGSAGSPKCDLTQNTLWPLYGPLLGSSGDQSLVIGQIGQSLDGRIATAYGHSHYINGHAAIVHLHRLRALVDAVVVGVGTVIADDPQLTVRRAALGAGQPQPARVVLDPSGRMPVRANCMQADGARRIVVRCGGGAPPGTDPDIEHIELPRGEAGMAPDAILAALATRGLKRVLVEGGAKTLSRFLAAGCLQRLHIMIAPMIIGAGPAGIELAAIERLDDALRPAVTTFALPDGDVLFDCAFSSRSGRHD
jgi:diaminohydroxyphosphoribosylaminopyrimidine deaminase/5-amino-6-(5-phosphoribosylamino)uracil reductase